MKREHDLAEYYFFSRWPKWLRWLLLIPGWLIIGIVLPFVIGTLVNFAIEKGSLEFLYLNAIFCFIVAYFSIYVGTIIAPQKQFIVAIILFVIETIFILIMTNSMITTNSYDFSKGFTIIESILLFGGGLFALIKIYGENDLFSY